MKAMKWVRLALVSVTVLGVAAVLACGSSDLAPQATQPAQSGEAMVLPHERSVVECLLEVAPDGGVYVSSEDAPDRVRTDANRFSEDDCASMIIDSGEEYEASTSLEPSVGRVWHGAGDVRDGPGQWCGKSWGRSG